MDRQITYPGQIPLETDLLNTNKNIMVALGLLAQDLFGTSTVVSGFTCTPTGPATMNVLVNPGRIYSLTNIDGTAYSSLAADTTHQVLKQGILLDAIQLSCPAPATAGYSINYLIQATYQDTDANGVTLPYYNSSNPTQAYSGPANSGASQYTVRKGTAVITAKAGVAATTGSQLTPAPDAGYVGMFVVSVANGAASITSGNISTYGAAPFVGQPLQSKANSADLANSSTSSLGAGLIGLALTGANEVATTLAPFLNLTVKGLKRHFGARGDGSTNDYTALANALTATGKLIEIEEGTFLFNTALPSPSCGGIVGRGELISILKPGASVAKALSLAQNSGNYPRELRSFLLDGSLTSSALGVVAGDVTSLALTMDRVQIKNFTGTNAVGLKVDQLLKSTFKDLTLYGNQENLLIAGSGGGFPTTLHFLNLVNSNAISTGARITSVGGQVRFIGGNIDSSGAEGLKLIPAVGGTVSNVIVDGTWFEACNSAGQFMITVDGSASGATAGIAMRDLYFNNAAGSRKCIQFLGAGVRAVYTNPTFALAQTGNITVGSSAVARSDQWNPAYSFAANVSDNSGLALGTDGVETTWTPTYAAAGGGSIGSVSTNLARWRRIGSNMLKIDFNFSGTVSGVVNSISMQLYNTGIAGIGTAFKVACNLQVGGSYEAGWVASDGGPNLVFTRMNGAAFSAGAGGAVGSVMLETTS